MQREVRDTPDLLPDRAAHMLTKLTALTLNIADEAREADLAYARVLLKHLDAGEAVGRATLRAETSDEHARKREAEDLQELAKQMVISLRQFLRTKADEVRRG